MEGAALSPGRLAAYRGRLLPVKRRSRERDLPDGTWLLVVIKSRSEAHPQLYVVEEPAEPEDGGEEPTYYAYSQYLIPLPDMTAAAHPTHAPTSVVLAALPNTTSLYRATIISGPSPSTALVPPEDEMKQVYQVEFDHEGGAIREVPTNLLVRYPEQ